MAITPTAFEATAASGHSKQNISGLDRSNEVAFPIAIVGMALRLPGGVNTTEKFWDMLINKRDGHCSVPKTRYAADAFYDATRPGTVKTCHGYFLQEDIGCIDRSFFSMSKTEAAKLDPQQRLLLEVVWECMESGGQTNWRGQSIGCYVGVFGEDWLEMSSKDTQHVDRFHVVSAGDFALSNRVSYEYDLQGPSVTYRTACSSSMVALHDACQALYSGECSSAVVAGSNLILTPTMTMSISDNMILSPDGICKTFDASADGYGRGEAINAIYIKPLEEALRQGDPIRAVIRSTAVNCDGRTPSITTPGSEAQERLIRRAYRKAGIENISQTGFFECHGTGTIAGDTAETSVVAKLFTEGIHIGAVKPNVGHSEGASGITAIIKAALALEKRTIPPNMHFKNPNPSIPFQNAGLKVPLAPVPWPDSRCERVSVNSFGIGGTNAHVILESFSSMVHDRKKQAIRETGPQVLVLSAKNRNSLQKAVEDMKEFTAQGSFPVKDLAYTLGCRREHLGFRAFTIIDSDGKVSDFETSRDVKSGITFVFTGQGAQWAGMAKELMSTSPSFLSSIRFLDQQLSSLRNPPSWTLEEELSKDDETSRIHQPEFAQPLSTAVQLAVVDLLQEWGVRPTSVIGHSSGEIAAAYASGAMTAGVAMAVSYYRGKAVGDANMKAGAMAAVGLPATTASKYLLGDVAVACDNSPESVTLSGTSSDLDQVLQRIQAVDPETFCKRLKVSAAYHSQNMKEPGLAYEKMMKPIISHNEKMLPLYSTAREEVILNPTVLDASYWRENLQSTVLFNGAVQRLLQEAESPTLFVEIGPHSSLSSPLRQILRKNDSGQSSKYIPTLIRGQPQWKALLTTAGRLHINGAHVDLTVVNDTKNASILTDIPAYPWLHEESFIKETRLVREWRNPKEPHHELLGPRCLESTDLEPSWRSVLFAGHVPWLWDHVLGKELVFPCAGYIAMAGEAIRQTTGTKDYTIHNLSMKKPLVLKDAEAIELVTSLRPARLTMTSDSSWYEFTISAYQNGTWTKHCTGKVIAGSVKTHTYHEPVSYLRILPSKTWYEAIKRRGMNFGPHFRRLENISANPSSPQAGARVQYDDEGDCKTTSTYALHPTIIDQNLQMVGVAMCRGSSRHMTKLCMPVAIESIYVAPGRGSMFIDASCNANSDSIVGDATMISDNKVVLSMERGMLFAVEEVDETERDDSLIARIDWKPHINLGSLTEEVLPQMLNNRGLSLLDVAIRSMITVTADKIRSLHPKTAQLKEYQRWICSQADTIKSTTRRASSFCQEDSLEDITKEIEEGYVGLVPLLKFAGKISMLSNGLVEGNVGLEKVGSLEESLLCVYKSLASAAGCAHFFSLLCHSNPMLRVLTIGFGNGFAVTQALCELTSKYGTPMFSKCTVTDKAEDGIGRAKAALSWSSQIQYKTLDISRDPIEQGFEAEGYDLVIASEAFDTDMPMSPSLKHIFTLLAPGGRLFHQGVFSNIPLVKYVMGIFPEWWNRQDLACNGHSITLEQWKSELSDNGFPEADILTLNDSSIYHSGTTIAMRPYPPIDSSPKDIAILYLSTIPTWAQLLARSLETNGHFVKWVEFTNDPLPTTDVISVIDLEGPLFDDISPEMFTRFQQFVGQIKTSCILWITDSSQMSCKDSRLGLILGVARTIRHEVTPDFYTLEIDDFDDVSVNATIQVIEHINRQRGCSSLDPDCEFAVEQGKIHVSRAHWISARQELSTARPAVCGSKYLDIGTYGLLNSLAWSEHETRSLQSHEVEIDIKYIGLNFRDMMVALGVVGDRSEFGVEASGIVRRVGSSVTHVGVGDAVIVIGDGLLCTRKIVAAERCFPLSDEISLEDAATVACVYGTVILSLIYIGRLQKGQSVLIHCGCGGVGLAAIQICQMLGAEIFTTVGNDDKIKYLMDTFGIPRNRIFCSRDSSFFHEVMKETGNRGVDLVLNSLSGELLHLSWRCVAKFGKMVELGKRDLLGYGQLDMDVFAGNRSFIGVDAKQIIDEDIGQFQSIMQECMGFLKEGKIKPIRPLTVFDAKEISQAFRFMQTGKHIGKILVKMPLDPSELNVSPISTFINLPSNASIVIVGGLAGLGRTVATWLVEKGARDLVFMNRTGARSPGAQSFLEEIRSQGCSVTAIAGDVAKMEDVQRAVAACKWRIAGVIHMPMVLKDQLFSKMTHENWRSVLASKVEGTWNLHNALIDNKLDFFVCFGSLAGLCGNPGQTNYAAANAFLDAFVQYRVGQGLVGSVIDLGLMNDSGFAYENAPELIQRAKSASMRTVEERELVQALELAICRSGQIALGLGTTKPLSSPGVVPPWTRDARYSLWSNIVSATEPAVSSLDGDLKELMESIKSNPHILDDPATVGRISKILGVEIGSHLANIDDMDEVDINNMVIESLAMIEIRSWYRRHLGLELPLVEISNAQTIGGLGKVTVQALRAKYKEASSVETSAEATTTAEQANDLQYHQDATLGRNIQPISDNVPEWYAESEGHVLLIGATGFVGAFMLSTLVASPAVKTITCLVRAGCTTSAMNRLETAVAKIRLPLQSWDKVKAVTGDITHKDLGLEATELVRLAKECSAIFHLGAVVNYTLPYSAHRNANVLGLVNVLKFANNHRLKPVHYFSGMAAYGPTGFLSGPSYVPENEKPVAGSGSLQHHTGYSLSKYVAECIAWDAISNGFPLAIHRAGFVLGDSVTGIGNPDDAVNRLMSTCISLGAYPIPPAQRNCFVPVDFVCSAALHISLSNNNLGQAYNLIHPNPDQNIDLSTTFQMLSQLSSRPLRAVEVSEWAELMSKAVGHRLSGIAPIVAEKLTEGSIWWNSGQDSMVVHGTENLHKALEDRPDLLNCKTMFELLKTYFLQWSELSESRFMMHET